jgi:hypothetical protein
MRLHQHLGVMHRQQPMLRMQQSVVVWVEAMYLIKNKLAIAVHLAMQQSSDRLLRHTYIM